MNWGGSGITKPLFDWITAHLPHGQHILELGSGDVSTWHLSENYCLTSVEDDERYLYKYPSRYIHAPLVDGWYSVDILKKELPEHYDLILVDGPTGSEPRTGFLRHWNLFLPGVPVVIDDTWRSPERQMAHDLAALTGYRLEVYEHFCALNPVGGVIADTAG